MTTAPKTKQDIYEALAQVSNEIAGLGVRRLGLFGSFHHGTQTPDSDIDFIVEFQEGQKTFDNLIRLGFLLEDLLQRRIELITPESLSPYIGPRLLRDVEYVPLAA